MKKILCLLSVIAIVLALSFSHATEAFAEDTNGATITHTVVKGDTLWALAEKYLKDSGKWAALWKNNPDIKNPHLIRPGDILKISPNGIVVERDGKQIATIQPEEKPAQPAEEPKPAAKKIDITPGKFAGEITEPASTDIGEFYTLSKVVSDSLVKHGVLSETQEDVGKVLTSADGSEKILYQGKKVFLALKNPEAAEIGDAYSVYKKGAKIKHPKTKKFMGYSIEFLGAVEITSKDNNNIEGIIVWSHSEITPGDTLTTLVPKISEIPLVPAKAEISAYIVGAFEKTKELSKDSVVYLDKGLNDGLENGNILLAYKDRGTTTDPYTGTKTTLPSINAGKLIVVKAYQTNSMAIVIDTVQPLNVGDIAKTRVSDDN